TCAVESPPPRMPHSVTRTSCAPIQDNDDWRRWLGEDRIHEKSLSVGRDDVLVFGRHLHGTADPGLKETDRHAPLNRFRAWADLEWHCGERAVRRNVEQFMAVPGPAHLRAPCRRHLPARAV